MTKHFECAEDITDYLKEEIIDVLSVNKTSTEENLQVLKALYEEIGESIKTLEEIRKTE